MSSDGRDDDWAECLVRARVIAGGSDRRVSLVRVGWLTADLAAAIGEDVRHAPTGTWLELLVPDDLGDGEIASIRDWLRSLVSPHVRVEVGRSTDRAGEAVRPSTTPPCGIATQDGSSPSEEPPAAHPSGGGTGLADLGPRLHHPHPQRRRSEE
jgi:hypothetical protein